MILYLVSNMISNNIWTRIKRERGLYRYNPSGQYFARVRFHSKLYRRKLDTDDLALAKRKLRSRSRNDLERTDATKGNTSFAKVLDDYSDTLTGADTTKADKRVIIDKLKENVVWHRLTAAAHNQTFASDGLAFEALRR